MLSKCAGWFSVRSVSSVLKKIGDPPPVLPVGRGPYPALPKGRVRLTRWVSRINAMG